MSTVEVRVSPRAENHSRVGPLRRQVIIDGNDISSDVLSALVGINPDGSVTVTVDLVASVVDVSGNADSVQLTNATVAGLNAMGWRTDDQVRRVLEQINNDGSAEASNAMYQAIHDAMARYMETLPDNDVAYRAALGAMQAILDGLPKTMPVEKPE